MTIVYIKQILHSIILYKKVIYTILLSFDSNKHGFDHN